MQNFVEINKDDILNEEKNKITLIDNTVLNLENWTSNKNNVQLIINEIKPLFGIKKLKRYKCTIGTKKYIATETCLKEDTLKNCNYISETDLKNIRYAYVFRYLVGITKNYDSSIYYIKKKFSSYVETAINYETSDISRICLKKWFSDDWRTIYRIIRTIKNSYTDLMTLKFKIDEIINSVDNSYIWLSTKIIERMEEIMNSY